MIMFIAVLCISQLRVHQLSYFYRSMNIPKYTPEQMYQTLQHGDVVNMARFDDHNSLIPALLLKFFNYRMAHCSLIIEEQGKKYVVEASPDLNYLPERAVTTSKYALPVKKWHMFKIPLMEYILAYPSNVYRIISPTVRSNFKLTDEDYTFDENSRLFFCTQYVGDILHRHGIIPKCSKMIRYRPTELINLLTKSGFTSSLVVC
jgi:hypothetical protein